VKTLRRCHFVTLPPGFTLIELLVVVAILATVGMVTATAFFQALKGASKAELTKQVKQEGDFAISVMERMIRNAKSVDCTGSFGDSLRITNQDGNQTTFHCCSVSSLIASESGTLTCGEARLTSSKVVVSSYCNQFIRCTQTGSAPPVVEIRFSLSQLGSSARPEERASMDFQTTVSLRTY